MWGLFCNEKLSKSNRLCKEEALANLENPVNHSFPPAQYIIENDSNHAEPKIGQCVSGTDDEKNQCRSLCHVSCNKQCLKSNCQGQCVFDKIVELPTHP